MGALDDGERIMAADAAEWRAWLEVNHATSKGAWLVRPRPGSDLELVGYEDAIIERLNEEHGVVDVSRCSRKPQVGERVRILPNHVCVVSNLHDEIALARGGVLLDTKRVEARGKTR